VGLEYFYKSLVGRVWQVNLPILFGSKTYKKQVCKTLVEVFGTVVGSPLKAFDFFDLLGQCPKGILDLFNLSGTTGILELEQNGVT
jgi:hypothetical protein